MVRLAPTLTLLLERPENERRIGPFMLMEQLGRGGFAPVWLAREVYGATTLRTVAVKLFSLEGALGAEGQRSTIQPTRSRIVEEAHALCRVEHPNVVRYHTLSIDEPKGVMGIVMEHVAGRPLDQRLAAEKRLPVHETLAMGTAIASALSAVHRAGLVHRDVKPGNVVEADGGYKLIDFGIAEADALLPPEPPPAQEANGLQSGISRAARSPDATRGAGRPERATGVAASDVSTNRVGLPCGTAGYIDPACVLMDAPASPASDLYALGAMLFECVTGKLPAAAHDEQGDFLLASVLDGRAPPPSLLEAEPDAPPSLARLIDSLIAPDRRERPPSAEWVAIRLEQIRSEIAGQGRALPPEEEGPFRGLGRFEQSDRDVHFGRASEVAAALDMLRSRGVVALVGPSGSGKSSLARAGVLPAVAEGALGGWPKRWDAAILEPGNDPRAAVVAALSPLLPDAADHTPDALVIALTERFHATGRGTVLLLDQLEELATIAAPESQAWTVALLARLAEQTIPGVRAVVAVRRDLLDPLLALGELGKALVRGLLLIEPITELTWGDVLDQALAAYGYTFEDDALRRALLADLKGTAGAMPLVQFALTELWRKRDTSRKEVTHAGLSAIGGIAGALERHADATLAEIGRAQSGAEDAARTILLALTTPQGTRAVRSMAELAESAGPASDELVHAFEKARLVVRVEGGVTLAHEALLTQWGRLRTWVVEAREDRMLADELERDATKWRADPESTPLWQKRRLAHAEELRGGLGGAATSATAVAFLEASRWAARRARLVSVGAIVVVVSLAGVGLAYVQAVRAQQAQAADLEQNKAELRVLKQMLEEPRNSEEKETARRIVEGRIEKKEQEIRDQETPEKKGSAPPPPRSGIADARPAPARPPDPAAPGATPPPSPTAVAGATPASSSAAGTSEPPPSTPAAKTSEPPPSSATPPNPTLAGRPIPPPAKDW